MITSISPHASRLQGSKNTLRSAHSSMVRCVPRILQDEARRCICNHVADERDLPCRPGRTAGAPELRLDGHHRLLCGRRGAGGGRTVLCGALWPDLHCHWPQRHQPWRRRRLDPHRLQHAPCAQRQAPQTTEAVSGQVPACNRLGNKIQITLYEPSIAFLVNAIPQRYGFVSRGALREH